MPALQHNMVNLLYTMKGLIEAHLDRFEEGYFKEDKEALSHAHEIMKRVYAQAERALEVTRKISRVMKMMKQDGTEPLDRISLKEVWEEVMETLGKWYSMEGLEIISGIPEEFPRILCGRGDLLEIFYCLADNAIQAMQGKGKLIIRASLGFRSEEDAIANVTVADTGPGIPGEVLNHLFEPFMTTKTLEKGNGLGLCLVKGLVRRNGGGISVSSFPGCGTTFTLTFPVAKAKDTAEEKVYALAG